MKNFTLEGVVVFRHGDYDGLNGLRKLVRLGGLRRYTGVVKIHRNQAQK